MSLLSSAMITPGSSASSRLKTVPCNIRSGKSISCYFYSSIHQKCFNEGLAVLQSLFPTPAYVFASNPEKLDKVWLQVGLIKLCRIVGSQELS